jgi:hypothetical protein
VDLWESDVECVDYFQNFLECGSNW